MASNVQPASHQAIQNMQIKITCIHCKEVMNVYLDYAMGKMGTWDLEFLENDIGTVGIEDTGMDVDSNEKEKGSTTIDTYVVSIVHRNGNNGCGKETPFSNAEFRELIKAARVANGV